MAAFSTPGKKEKKVIPESAEPETPPRVSSKRRLDMKASEPKTPMKSELRESDSYSTMASQGSPTPSLATTLVMGQTPPPTPGSPTTPPTRQYGRGISSGMGPVEENVPPKIPKGEPINPKAEVAQGTEWVKKYGVESIPMMSADTESEEEAPENVRLIMRVNRLRMDYREMKNHNSSYGCASEPWTSFKDGMLRDGGWRKRGGTWVKPGALPAVTLPKKVLKQIKEPGMIMPYSDWKIMAARKPSRKSPKSMKSMKSMKSNVQDFKSKPSRPSMRKPASAAKGSSPGKGKRTLQSFFSKKGSASASSSGRKWG